MCECYTIDVFGADPDCPVHGTHGVVARLEHLSEASLEGFERWYAREFPFSTGDREFALTVWQAAVAFMGDI